MCIYILYMVITEVWDWVANGHQSTGRPAGCMIIRGQLGEIAITLRNSNRFSNLVLQLGKGTIGPDSRSTNSRSAGLPMNCPRPAFSCWLNPLVM